LGCPIRQAGIEPYTNKGRKRRKLPCAQMTGKALRRHNLRDDGAVLRRRRVLRHNLS